MPNEGTLVVILFLVAVAMPGSLFVLRQRRAREPAVRLEVAGRQDLLGGGCAGIIVFGSLMGAMFVGQQFLQNVLSYSTLEAGGRDPARGGLHGAGRAALGQARRSAGRAT